MRSALHIPILTAVITLQLVDKAWAFTKADPTQGAKCNHYRKCNLDPLMMVASLDGLTENVSPVQKLSQIAQHSIPLMEENRLPHFDYNIVDQAQEDISTMYSNFAKELPVVNNMMLASLKAATADLLAQTVISHSGLDMVDWQRTLLFCLFGAFYQGGFQYLYQVEIFSKLFDVEKFTSQPWMKKLRDGPGLRSLGVQDFLDLLVMSLIYLPTYYTFKAGVFSGTMDPGLWVHNGISCYESHFARDEIDLLRVWLPADLFCFSVPLILRLPMRQVISLFYTAYLSYASFGN